MKNRIMVTGVPGVGKSTVLASAIINEHFDVFEFGDQMLRLGSAFNVNTKADILKLPIAQRVQLQTAVAGLIVSDPSRRNTLIDGHLLVASTSGFAPGLPYSCIAMLGLTAVVFLTAEPSEIVGRREKEKAKYETTPGWDSPDKVAEHQELARNASLTYTLMSEASYTTLVNAEDQQKQTAHKLREYLRSVWKA